ncbi:hypothetical protein ASG31_03600 [Chryseobacterium sp. Leaf404]|uniref:hypothetical protein n=1 Tax=unclassified Chryseobacterium TaxID=2593645 RepID=UPI0006F2AD1E|nr:MULTISPECIES: hypothetical protein [unclassified Chryseobacterium]KQT22420.1 hypothetical protein ASG31_03600 [Chryseobacterium sp. Leaf404]
MIKKTFYLTFTLAFISIFAQKKISKDENGKHITEAEFQSRWRDDNLNFFRWDYMEKGKRICTLKDGQVSNPELNYESTLKVLESKLDIVFTRNAIVVLNFWYYNDICSSIRDDNWPSSELREVKEHNEEYLMNIRKALRKNKQDLYVFYIFEKGSKVKKKKSDYFKSFIEDSDDFFREKYFKEQAMCGSNLIITPSGNLLYNGEAILGGLLERVIN